MPPLDRRRFVATSAASLSGTALLAGCSALGSGKTVLEVSNERDAAVAFRLEVAKTDPGTVVFQEDLSLDAGASRSFEPDLESGVPYQVIVTTDEGRDGGEVTLEGESSRIDVRIGDDVTVSRSSG